MTSRLLEGRVALITGSARRVGRAVALKFAQAGAAVVVNSRGDAAGAAEAAAAIERSCGADRVLVCLADVTDAQAVDRMVKTIVDRFGRLDILVNNANARREAESKSVTQDEWDAVVRTTLDGPHLCARASAPFLGERGDGRIINVAGVTANTGSANHPHVVAAKAGLLGLTRAMATDYGPTGITVNCISPALIFGDNDDPTRRERLLRNFPLERTPLRRTGTVDELAAAIVALCGPEWRFMTGQTIHFNGGAYFG